MFGRPRTVTTKVFCAPIYKYMKLIYMKRDNFLYPEDSHICRRMKSRPCVLCKNVYLNQREG